jgi:hypothetical protein
VRGRVVYCGKHGTAASLKEYGRLIAEFAASASVPAKLCVAAGAITVVELADAYYQHCEGYYQKNGQPSGWLSHINLMLDKHLGGLYGDAPAAQFGPKAFKTIRQTLIDAAHSRKYINKHMPIVKAKAKYVVDKRLGGVMIWSLNQDAKGNRSPLSAIDETLAGSAAAASSKN